MRIFYTAFFVFLSFAFSCPEATKLLLAYTQLTNLDITLRVSGASHLTLAKLLILSICSQFTMSHKPTYSLLTLAAIEFVLDLDYTTTWTINAVFVCFLLLLLVLLPEYRRSIAATILLLQSMRFNSDMILTVAKYN